MLDNLRADDIARVNRGFLVLVPYVLPDYGADADDVHIPRQFQLDRRKLQLPSDFLVRPDLPESENAGCDCPGGARCIERYFL